jgi:cytochrome c biogenesis protein CcmG/thiol:disulfide interchange protein DsbE
MIRPRLVFLLPAAIFLLFLVMAAIALYGTINGTRNTAQVPNSVLIGRPAPALPEHVLPNHLRQDLEHYKGKPVLVNFMASWCVPCRAEIPALDVLKADVVIIGIAYKDKPHDTAEFLEQYGNPYDTVWVDDDGRAGIRWGIYGVPESFLIDGKGRIVLRHAGPIFKSVITDDILPALEKLK